MRISKRIMVTVLSFLVLLAGCSRTPSVTFCAKWSDNLTEMWSKSSNVLNYSELESKDHIIYGGMGATSSEKCFALLIKGNLPLGQINIKAVHMSGGKRETVFILPAIIQNNDPQANLWAVLIYQLQPLDPIAQGVTSYLGTYTVDRGRYYIFLEKDDVELAGGELLIR